ncbi:helix-turn-helix domain-containing protein [Psychrobacter frigidicola]|uniref:helix-turn-helix domain-containing protein n=1 Tax=Psychrobacter frigidicola TaxID=45611 RepID=UPI001917D8DE|nr:helix-turn-helix domain-containing protein [Psychrobacter frigidicola]
MTQSLSNEQPAKAQQSFGAMLQHARQSKKLSLEEASSELFILKRHLQALEDESFDDLPQAAFARGFAINYAKFLDLDAAQVATSFDATYPEALKLRAASNSELPLRPMGTLQRDSQSRIRFNPLLIVAVIALIVLVIFLFRMVSNASKNDQATSPVTDELTATEQAQGAAINTQSNEIGASGSALNLGGDSDNQSLGYASLQVILTDTAIINITDASGNSLMSGSQTRGDYKLTGMPPFNIEIDNVDNVRLLLNQETVVLDQYATGKRASFELSP